MGEAFMRRRGSAEEIEWKKYNAVKVKEGYYVDDTSAVGDAYSSSATALAVGSGYDWSDSNGWFLTGTDIVNARDAVGYYCESPSGKIVELTSYDENNGLSGVVVAAEEYVQTGYHYGKGTKSYGTVTAKKGVYPGTGSVVDGSPAEGWCVMLEGNTYYYYEKVQ